MNFAEEERKQGKYVDPVVLSLTCNGCHFHGLFSLQVFLVQSIDPST